MVKLKDDKKVLQICSATLKLVAEKGLAGITMGDISAAAGIATGTLYVYFKSKDELINTLFAACRENAVEAYFRKYDPAAPFKPGFRTIWTNIFRYRLHYFEESVFMEQCYHSPFINEATREQARQLAAPFYALMKRGQEEQLLKDMDVTVMLTFMMGAVNELVRHIHYSGGGYSRQLVQTTFDLCWDALRS